MPLLTPEIIQHLLPPNVPSPQSLPRGVSSAAFSDRLAGLDDLRRRAFAWSALLQAIVEEQRYDRIYAGFRFATFGFIPLLSKLPQNIVEKAGYVFGIAIERGPTKAKHTPEQILQPLEVQGHVLALAINRRPLVLHVAHPVTPVPGTGACWARSNRTTQVAVSRDGVLTAEHVISGTVLGGFVSASLAGVVSQWQLADSGDCKIDAALITQAQAIPINAAALAVQAMPAPGTDIEILGHASPNPVFGKIAHTMIFPNYLSELNPMRVFLDVHGIPGDSGALVRETNKGPGVGIYMGQTNPYVAPNGQVVEGVCQYLEQARDALNLDLFL